MDNGDTSNLIPTNEPEKPVENRQSNGTFGPGNNANPTGRPKKGWTWRELIIEELDKNLATTDGNKVEAKKAVVKRLIKMSLDGDVSAMR